VLQRSWPAFTFWRGATARMSFLHPVLGATGWIGLFGPVFCLGAALLFIRCALTRSIDRWFAIRYIWWSSSSSHLKKWHRQRHGAPGRPRFLNSRYLAPSQRRKASPQVVTAKRACGKPRTVQCCWV
jgi:hypothetical protein